MTIVRAREAMPYYRDPSISMAACGFLTHLLYENGAEIGDVLLSRGAGWDEIDAILGELEAAGYIEIDVDESGIRHVSARSAPGGRPVEQPARQPRQSVESSDSGHVYLLYSDTGYHKIGRSRHINLRVTQLGIVFPGEISLIHHFPADSAKNAELELHRTFAGKRHKGEWFRLEPADVEAICKVTEYSGGRWKMRV